MTEIGAKIMTACFMVAQGALIRCLVQLGKTNTGDWLSGFEDELVRDAIIMVRRAPTNSEILVERVVQMLHFIFDSARRQITKESKNS